MSQLRSSSNKVWFTHWSINTSTLWYSIYSCVLQSRPDERGSYILARVCDEVVIGEIIFCPPDRFWHSYSLKYAGYTTLTTLNYIYLKMIYVKFNWNYLWRGRLKKSLEFKLWNYQQHTESWKCKTSDYQNMSPVLTDYSKTCWLYQILNGTSNICLIS